MEKRVSNMWELYDALLAGLPRTGTVARTTAGERWTLVETDMGGAGYAMTTEGDSIAPRYPKGIEGMRIRVAAEAARSWNFIEAGLGVAAINAFYNTPERMAELGCAEPYDNYCLRGLDVTGRKVGLIGHLRMPPGTLDTAESVYILEKHPKPGDYPDSACEFILPDCDIVLITGSSIRAHNGQLHREQDPAAAAGAVQERLCGAHGADGAALPGAAGLWHRSARGHGRDRPRRGEAARSRMS